MKNLSARAFLTLAGTVVCLLTACLPASDGSDSQASGPTSEPSQLVADYLERYFQAFPTRATAAGRHEFDHQLEDLGPEARSRWTAYNHEVAERSKNLIRDTGTQFEERLDLELLNRQARRVVLDYETRNRPGTDPLYWSGLLSNATVMLLVRDDLPASERLASAAARARHLPRLARQAEEALASGDPGQFAPGHAQMAARQLRASATFYREGFPLAGGDAPETSTELANAGLQAAEAFDRFAEFLSDLATRASGSARLGANYEERFQVVTGIQDPVETVLAQALSDLDAKRSEAAAYGREIWNEVLPDEPIPGDETDLVRRLFERASADRADNVDEFVDHYRSLIADSTQFVREREIVTLPEPLTLVTDRSPSFFIGQSVGGVYPAGPYSTSDAPTLLFLPTPSEKATPSQRDGFYRDFNEHFNAMITPHEVIPGHYLQLKYAARHPHKIRALFGDGVYIEGWGTFCERLMLDLGWGGPLDRVAHLKKQLENIARTIVDIRVHTGDMSRDEVLQFVREEALQDEQFAANMWRRATTSSPQLTFYYLGYRQVHGLYTEVRESRGDSFVLLDFMNEMMEMGPVPVRHYRSRFLEGRNSEQ